MNRKKYYWLLLPAIIICLLYSYTIEYFDSQYRELKRAASQASGELITAEKKATEVCTAEFISSAIQTPSLSEAENDSLCSLPFSILGYRNDSLVFWNSSRLIPSFEPVSIDTSMKMQKFRSGYFIVYNQKLPARVHSDSSLLNVIILLPVKYDYGAGNSYLKSFFSPLFSIGHYFTISDSAGKEMAGVTNAEGKNIFYIGVDPALYDQHNETISAVAFIIAFLLFLWFLSFALDRWPQAQAPLLRFVIIWVTFLFVALVVSDKTLLPVGLRNAQLFNSNLFASSGIAQSLGSLLFSLIYLAWAAVYISNKSVLPVSKIKLRYWYFVIHMIGFLLIFLLSFYSVALDRSLVRDSKIYFGYFNPFDPDYYSLAAVFCVALIGFILLLLSRSIISFLQHHALRRNEELFVLGSAAGVVIAIFWWVKAPVVEWMIIPWAVILISLLVYAPVFEWRKISMIRLLLFVGFFSVSGAGQLSFFQHGKEKELREQYAAKLIKERDAVTEFLLSDLTPALTSDRFVINYFNAPQFSSRELLDRLQQLYFSEGFNRYHIKYFPLTPDGEYHKALSEESISYNESSLKSGMIELEPNQLYYSFNQSGSLTYLAEYTFADSGKISGKLLVELKADVYRGVGVYPELLLDDKDKLPLNSAEYSSAIYYHNQLISQSGFYSYNFKLSWQLPLNFDMQFQNHDGSNHLLYRSGLNLVVVVSKRDNGLDTFFSFFSYLFLLQVFIILFVILIHILLFKEFQKSVTEFFRRASLRTMIQGFFLAFMFLLIVIIGYITSTLIIKQSNTSTQNAVTEQIDEAAKAASTIYDDHDTSAATIRDVYSLLRKNISSIAAVSGFDLNIYDLNGDLITSSQPSIFEKGLLSKKIDPIAFHSLVVEERTTRLQTEQIGSLHFISGYQALRDVNGRLLAVIQLPYYNSKEDLNNQIGFFFATLFNILVFATLIAGLMAPIVSKQITQRLSLIGNRLGNINLSGKNERIDWPALDEIGQLVKQYNKMITELQMSAQKLAQSERQTAWREMAKQVAHEIKNPLTPMKLSVQHLQRAYQQNAPNLQELTGKVTRTLIEQIDALSNIASEFSSFAKMPEANIETVALNGVLESCCKLFNENVEVKISGIASQDLVSVDKNQLIQIFNNLLLNAQQSIPDNREGLITAGTSNEGDSIIISISDNGNGIEPALMKKIFMPNFTTKSSGSGLGLAICKNIIESFDGSISFETRTGIGTTFFISLPLKKGTPDDGV